MLENRRSGADLHPTRSKGLERTLRKDGHRLQPDDIFRATRSVYLSGRDHRGDAAMHVAVDPPELILAGRPVAANRMHMAVDETGRKRAAFGVNRYRGPGGVHIALFAEGGNAISGGDHGVGVKDGSGQVSAEHESDVADDKFALSGGFRGLVARHDFSFRQELAAKSVAASIQMNQRQASTTWSRALAEAKLCDHQPHGEWHAISRIHFLGSGCAG